LSVLISVSLLYSGCIFSFTGNRHLKNRFEGGFGFIATIKLVFWRLRRQHLTGLSQYPGKQLTAIAFSFDTSGIT
jgi:hypothetical protein